VDFSNPSWTLGLSWQANDDLLLYAEGRRSWRAGGLNGTAPPMTEPAAQGGNLFEPEYTRDVEIGAKLTQDVWNMPSHFNIALYNQWIDNVQRAEFPIGPHGGSIAVTINVPEAQVSGLEFEAGMQPAGWLEVGFAGALTDARFIAGRNTTTLEYTPGVLQTYVFNPYADTPRESGSLYATVTLPVPDKWGRMRLRTDVYAQSDDFFSNNNSTLTPGTKIPGYGLVNMRYEWSGIMGSNFSFAAFAKNLFNKEYYTGGFSLSGSLGVSSAAIGTPQMFGAEVTYNF
jgi:iron complex outermembrane receptor protein